MEILLLTLVILIYFIVDTIYIDYFKYKSLNKRELDQIEDFLEKRTPQIQLFSSELDKVFCCNLCHSHRLDTNVVSIPGPEYSHISNKRPHKFLKNSCMSCGYSEYYNLNIMWGPDGLDPLPLDNPFYEKFRYMCDTFQCKKCLNKHAVAKTVTLKKKGFRADYISDNISGK